MIWEINEWLSLDLAYSCLSYPLYDFNLTCYPPFLSVYFIDVLYLFELNYVDTIFW